MRPNWFVAFPVAAGAWLAPVQASVPRAVRAFAAEDLHVTLAFFGGVEEAAARAGWAEAARRARELAPMTARLGAAVPMGSPRHWSALSAGVESEPLARALREHAPAVSRAAETKVDERPPRPHLTLARVSRRASPDERRAAVRWAADLLLAGTPIELSELALYTWSEDRRVCQFVLCERAPLGV